MSHQISARRSFMSGIGAALAAVGLGSGTASAQVAGPYTPFRHPEDDWMERPVKHRVIIDAPTLDSPPEAFRFASNLLTTNQSAYGLKDEDFGLLIVIRHSATAFGFSNAIWAKYGEILSKRRGTVVDPETGKAPVRNIYVSLPGKDGGTATLDGLAKRGVQFAICGSATRGIAGSIAQATGGNADAINKEITSDPLTNARFVSAGVVAVTRAQERGYSLIHAG